MSTFCDEHSLTALLSDTWAVFKRTAHILNHVVAAPRSEEPGTVCGDPDGVEIHREEPV